MKLNLPNIDLSKIEKKYLYAVPAVIIVMIMMYTGKGSGPSSQNTKDGNQETTSGAIQTKNGGINVTIVDPTPLPEKANEAKLVIGLWKEEIPVISDAVEYYKKKNPNLEVTFRTFSVSNYMNELSTALSRKEDIDVFLIRNVHDYAGAKEKKLAYDIEQSVRSESIDTAKYGSAFKDIRAGGKLFGLPYKRNMYALFYNKSIFEKMKLRFPTQAMTWGEFRDLAEKISSLDASSKIWGAYMDMMPQSWFMQALQKGSKLDDSNYINFEMALQYRIRMENIGATPRYRQIKNLKMHYNTEFQKGFVAMHVAGDWHIQQLLASKLRFEWDVAPAPYPEDGNQNLSIGNYSLACINANTKDIKKSFNFLKFLTGQDGAMRIAKNLSLPGFIDDSVSAFYAEQISGEPQNIRAVARQDFVLEYPVDVRGYEIANEILFEEGEAVLEGKQNIKTFSDNVQQRIKKGN